MKLNKLETRNKNTRVNQKNNQNTHKDHDSYVLLYFFQIQSFSSAVDIPGLFFALTCYVVNFKKALAKSA